MNPQELAEAYAQARRAYDDHEALINTDMFLTGALNTLRAAQREVDTIMAPYVLERTRLGTTIKTTQDSLVEPWMADPSLPHTIPVSIGEIQLRVKDKLSTPEFDQNNGLAMALLDNVRAKFPNVIKAVTYNDKALLALVSAGVSLEGVTITKSATLALKAKKE
ncbi:MAG: hypothetical protein KKB70_05645 [Proteobacteria bacterium]|nr:hypothetical protein [Pseudomonadota bacterium]